MKLTTVKTLTLATLLAVSLPAMAVVSNLAFVRGFRAC